MSVFDYILDNDFNQRVDIEELKEKARRKEFQHTLVNRKQDKEIRQLQREIEHLTDQVFALNLTVGTLLQYLRDTPGWNEQNFRALLLEKDLEDGELDGKFDQL